MNKQFIVYTDLDGTLLNHDDYSFDDALPVLKKLSRLNIPVIPVTSKTLAEVLVLAKKLELNSPIIVENGAIIAFPEGYFPENKNYVKQDGYLYEHISTSYSEILSIIHQLRSEEGYKFKGFSDMTVEEVISLTELSEQDAENAKKRAGTEPILWLDEDKRRLEFEAYLQSHALSLVKGGRFWHIMGRASKGSSIKVLNGLFNSHRYEKILSIGLGDSPNDISMLETVDVPVIVQTYDGQYMEFESSFKCKKTEFPGPKGWNQFMLDFLEQNYNN